MEWLAFLAALIAGIVLAIIGHFKHKHDEKFRGYKKVPGIPHTENKRRSDWEDWGEDYRRGWDD